MAQCDQDSIGPGSSLLCPMQGREERRSQFRGLERRDAHPGPEVYLFSGGLKVGSSGSGTSAAHFGPGGDLGKAAARTSHHHPFQQRISIQMCSASGGGPGPSDAAAKLRSGGATGAKRQGVPPHTRRKETTAQSPCNKWLDATLSNRDSEHFGQAVQHF
jgi:hypothetical protein